MEVRRRSTPSTHDQNAIGKGVGFPRGFETSGPKDADAGRARRSREVVKRLALMRLRLSSESSPRLSNSSLCDDRVCGALLVQSRIWVVEVQKMRWDR